MSLSGYGIPPRPASGTRRAAALLPYVAVLLGLYLLSSAWAALLLYQLGMVGCLLGWTPRLRAGTGLRARAAGLALASALAGGLPVLLLWFPLGLDRGVPVRLLDLGLSGIPLLGCFLSLILVHPVLEELFWRGAMVSRNRGPAADDVLFAGYHALVLVFFLPGPWVAVSTAAIVLAAWMWRRLAVASGGLLLPVISHVAADLGILGAVWMRLSGSGPR